jgi:hypothetical protein
MNYVGCSFFKENPATKQIGEAIIFRTIPHITSHLMFFDFNTILTRSVDFSIGVLMSIDIKKRAIALLKLAQE